REAVGQLGGHRHRHRGCAAVHARRQPGERRGQAAGLAPQGERLLDRGDDRAVDHARDFQVRAADVPAQHAAAHACVLPCGPPAARPPLSAESSRATAAVTGPLLTTAASHVTVPSAAKRTRRSGGPGGGGTRPRQASSARAAMLTSSAARTPRYAVVSRGFTSVTTGPASVSTRSMPTYP